MLDVQFMLRVLAASFATVGVVEAIKNFWKTERKIFYAVLMIPLSCACYVSVELLPLFVIGSVLTIASVQLCYQTLVQGFKAIIESMTNKIKGSGVASESGEDNV